jgi:DNA (cytosine-5)-methyltransferase 1
VVLVENVPAFSQWVLFPAWCDAMHRLGYAVAPHLVDAADHGVPQHRARLFLLCTRSNHPMHLDMERRPHRAIADVIDWSAGDWSDIERAGRSSATLKRIDAGRCRFGVRFLAPYYSSGSGLTGRSIHRPIGTITTRDRWAVIDGQRMRMLRVAEAKLAMGFPARYALPGSHRDALFMLGNAVCPPVVADLLTSIRSSL